MNRRFKVPDLREGDSQLCVSAVKLPNEAMRSERRFKVPGLRFKVSNSASSASPREHEITKRTKPLMDRRFKIPDLRWGCPGGGHRPPLQGKHPGTEKSMRNLRNEAMRSARQFKVSGSMFKVIENLPNEPISRIVK
jgi:hypothetical protein